MKTFHNSPASPAVCNVPDINKYGTPDAWHLICKASSLAEQWMKSTKVLNLPNGCLVQVTTQQNDNVAEAVTFIPDVVYGNSGWELIGGKQ